MNIAKKLVTNDALTFSWADETSTTILFADLPKDMHTRAMQHGFSQKLGDAYSGATSVVEAKAKMQDVLDGLMENDWTRKGGGSSGGLWVEAFAKAAGESIENTLEAWNRMNDMEKDGVKKHPEVKAAKAEIDLERAKAKLVVASEGDNVVSLSNMF